MVETMRLSLIVFKIAGYLSKVAIFHIEHVFGGPYGMTPAEFRDAREIESMGCRAALFT